MPHAHTVRLLEAWRRLTPPGCALPPRTALSGLLLGPLAAQASVLARGPGGTWRFRTAGALVEDLHGRPLAGAELDGLWAAEDRAAVARALGEAVRRGRPWIAACRGETPRGRAARLELTLAPAAGPDGAADRCVMLHQPVTPLVRLGGETLGPLRLCAPAQAAGGAPRLVVDNTRPRPLGSPPRADVAER